MKAAKRTKKAVKKTKSVVRRVVQKVAKKATGLKKELAKKKAELTVRLKKVEKLVAQKDALVEKLRSELEHREKLIRINAKTLKETIEKAGKEVSDLKSKVSLSILEVKSKAESEAKRLKEELDAKSQALRGKMYELEEYKKAAEGKIFELEAKAKEYAAKIGIGEKQRPGLVTFKGSPLTLLGPELKVGDKAPDFRVRDTAMQPVTLEFFKGRVKIITSVPSLDTSVCDMETRRFNQEAAELPEKVAILTISMDLPFAQARWCAAAGVEKVKTFSDYQDRSFGLTYGVLVKELKLLARTVFIVDERDVIRYIELVPEMTKEPDYDRILNTVRALV